MFLSEFKDNGETRYFFLKLARLVAISEGNIEGFKSQVSWGEVAGNTPEFYQSFMDSMISDDEGSMLLTYQREMGIEDRDVRWGYCDIRDHFIAAINEVVEAAKEDADLKKWVMKQLIENGVDIININQDVIKAQLLFSDVVRKGVYLKTMDLIFESAGYLKEETHISSAAAFVGTSLPATLGFLALSIAGRMMTEIKSLSDYQKKVIIFELVGIAQADCEYGTMEAFVIEMICDALGVDKGFLNDIIGVVQEVTRVNKEAIELLNE